MSYRSKDLCEAIRDGRDNVMRQFVRELSETSINSADWLGNTPLHVACGSHNNVRAVIELLAAPDINVNAKTDSGCTALMLAVKWGNKEIVKLLLDDHLSLIHI